MSLCEHKIYCVFSTFKRSTKDNLFFSKSWIIFKFTLIFTTYFQFLSKRIIYSCLFQTSLINRNLCCVWINLSAKKITKYSLHFIFPKIWIITPNYLGEAFLQMALLIIRDNLWSHHILVCCFRNNYYKSSILKYFLRDYTRDLYI